MTIRLNNALFAYRRFPNGLCSHGIKIFSLSLIAILTGCGGVSDRPELAYVTGKVTLDGTPLEKAKVYFQPESGRPSFGVTSSEGKYTLAYLADVKGAVPGKHLVKISTYDITENPKTGERVVTKEVLPETYHNKSNLQAEVKSGQNEISFELKSLGGKSR